MVVSAGGVPVGVEQNPVRPGSRRDVLRGLLAPAMALALSPVVAASRPPHGHPLPEQGDAFDETYRGRRIQGVRLSATATATGRPYDDERWQVTVDGRPLHLMRRADGSWLSMVDHYRSYPTPLDAARAAVDEMEPGEHLRELAPGPMDGGRMDPGGHLHGGNTGHMGEMGEMGGRRGVHA
ncbi:MULTISPECIES: tyrosinase cofactor [Streptomyces]|uniref:Tyrosinase cofactor n=1 Tax=Streptomyces gilvifuscus TaxID=1550617 RepID=A0ABT5FM21_9ACTN|nr:MULTISPECIES: tyrosinase cofactor [Streptomyces]MBK3642846.1 tyrosinase cofactor [Streptomyces sp. MBT33]MDC2953559.1 tyrosinase cofactor [Streptomyces gilvifuscus]